MVPVTANDWAKAIKEALATISFSPGTKDFLRSVLDQVANRLIITPKQIHWVEKRIKERLPTFFDTFDPEKLPDVNTAQLERPTTKKKNDDSFFNPMQQMAD